MEALASILTKDAMDLMCLCGQLKQRMLITECERDGGICYTLAHDLIRRVLIQREPESARRILHLRVAQYLESRLDRMGAQLYDRLVYHYEAGGNRLKALHYRILSLNAFTGLCFDLLPTLTVSPGREEPDAESLPAEFQRLEQEVSALRRLYAGQEELDRMEMTLLHAKSRYCIYNGLYEPGLGALEQLNALCRRRGEKQLLVQVHLQYIYYGIQICDTRVMEIHLAAGLALLDGEEHSESYGIYLRLNGLLEQMRGNYSRPELLHQSVRTLESLVSPSDDRYAINIAGAYNYIAECYRLEGRYEEAFGYYDKAIIHNRSRGYYPGAAVFYTNYGVCAFQKGEYEGAYQLFLYAAEIYRSSHEYSGCPLALGYLALYGVRQGDLAGAADKLKEAHRICDIIGSPWWKGVVIYLSWRIRTWLDQTGQEAPQLRALWPADEGEHCRWGLEFLKRIPPRLETEELQKRLEKL